MNKLKCQFCGNIYKNCISIINHITAKHGLSSKEYYDKFFKKIKEEFCNNSKCGKDVKYKNFNLGYYRYCSVKCRNTDSEAIELVNDYWNKPESRKRQSIRMKNGQSKYANSFNNTKEHRLKKSIRMKKLRQDPEFKKKMDKYDKTIRREKMLNGGAAYLNSFIKNTSKPQLKLFNIIKEIFSTAELNYQLLNYSVDIVVPQIKLAIEYDGSYWHKDKKEYDEKRQKEIEVLGWTFLRYEDYVPTKNEIIKDVYNLWRN